MKIVFFGSSDFVSPILEELSRNFQVMGVVTAQNSPIQILAEKLNLPVLIPSKINSKYADPEFISKLKNLDPDINIVASYGRLIPQIVIDLPKFGSLNIHPSLLPKFRGPTPVPAAILSGDRVSGVSIIKMDQEMDHGPILAQEEHSIEDKDAQTLLQEMFKLGAKMVVDIIPDYSEDKLELKIQDEEKVTFCHLMTKEDGYFEIENPPAPKVLERMIKAYFPWPTTWTNWKGKVVKLLPDGLIQVEGKRAVPAAAFLNGYPDFPLKNLS